MQLAGRGHANFVGSRFALDCRELAGRGNADSVGLRGFSLDSLKVTRRPRAFCYNGSPCGSRVALDCRELAGCGNADSAGSRVKFVALNRLRAYSSLCRRLLFSSDY